MHEIPCVAYKGKPLKVVDGFKYLGLEFTRFGDVGVMADARLVKGK